MLYRASLALSVMLLSLMLGGTSPGQQPALDAVSEEAAKLEGELGKLKDSTPEAAEIMLKLIDLYHENGRVMGLVTIGQSFVARHSNHSRHTEAMLKVLDGLVATSRNAEAVALARQFIDRHPDAAECPRLEIVAARCLDQLENRTVAGDAWATVFRRQPNTELGQNAAFKAIDRYVSMNNADDYRRAALVGEELIDVLPAGETCTQLGWSCVDFFRRGSDWVKSNAIAQKILEKSPPADPQKLADWHQTMAYNYQNQGQHANAAASYGKANAIKPTAELLGYQISYLNAAGARPGELDPLVKEFIGKYPKHVSVPVMRSNLALAHARALDPITARQILTELLPIDPVTNNNIGYWMNTFGNDKAELAEAERLLLAALGNRPANPAPLRYTLAISIYRDRLQDVAKARQMAMQMLEESPSNDGYTTECVKYLLYTATDPRQFAAELQKILDLRGKYPDNDALRDAVSVWIREAFDNDMHKERARQADEEFRATPVPETVKLWMAARENSASGAAARMTLIAGIMSDEQAVYLLRTQGDYFRYSSNPEERQQSAALYAALAIRFPQEFSYTQLALEQAGDYGRPEQAREAAERMLTIPPPSKNPDIWRRLMVAADNTGDPALVQRAFAYVQDAAKQFGPDPQFADTIGDILFKHKFEQEALEYWRQSMTMSQTSYHARACAERVLNRLEPEARLPLMQQLAAQPVGDFHGTHAMWLADDNLRRGDLDAFEKIMRDSKAVQANRRYLPWGVDEYPLQGWVDTYRNNPEAKPEDRKRVYTLVRDMELGRPSAAATLALYEMGLAPEKPIERLLAYQEITAQLTDNNYVDFDRLMPYAQSLMTKQDFVTAGVLLTGMLNNIPDVDEPRRQAARGMTALCYARTGAVGMSVDENSPIAPLLQAALFLRLGDESLAFDAYQKNQALFDSHRTEVPVELLLFVAERHIAAGGPENLERVEDLLRSWLVAHGEAKEIDEPTKARVQLLLAKNYFKAQRFDVARGEYTTLMNRFPKTPEAIEAEFGIGESYLEQKVYEQAEQIFENLANGKDPEVVIRAEFLRGILAFRRDDLDEARRIFRGVLDRVPNVELANETLFNLAEVYGVEQRHIEQLDLLRTVGRLGRTSKRWHSPGQVLSLVVQDSDLGISRGNSRIPVRVITEPGGDEELVYLTTGGAGKGLFRADLETRLGKATQGDRVLQLTGNDVIRCDYPQAFKLEFKNVTLPDSEIQMASDAKLEAASSKIIDLEEETFTERLEREEREREQSDRRVSQGRPANQIKPGNPLYVRVQDPDRDVSDEPDSVLIKMVATSGDQTQIKIVETEAHSGIFEGSCATGELPAGALASDTAIDHSPLMAIDRDEGTYWISPPDGSTPKWLAVDMKNLRTLNRATFQSPNAKSQIPVRGELQASQDGRIWFRVASFPPNPKMDPLFSTTAEMTQRVYVGNYTWITDWQQLVNVVRDNQPVETTPVQTLSWDIALPPQSNPQEVPQGSMALEPHAVIWHGQLVQPRAGAVRIAVQGTTTALALDGHLEMPVGPGYRTVDLWLDQGKHSLTIFTALRQASEGGIATIARADFEHDYVSPLPFRGADFDLTSPAAKDPPPRAEPKLTQGEGSWDFEFDPLEVRHVRLFMHEFLGEAVAINHVVLQNTNGSQVYIPTEADVLNLAGNDVLEIAAGDVVQVQYTDDFAQRAQGRSQLLSVPLYATYYNGDLTPIAYDFRRETNGAVSTVRKELKRIDPGDRIVVEIVDYDLDQSADRDTIPIQVVVNDGQPVELIATETDNYTGVFTKEIDTSATSEPDKLTVKAGDRIFCRYQDAQNTFPGHSVPREESVYVISPTAASVRIVESRILPAPERQAPLTFAYGLPTAASSSADEKSSMSKIAFQAPLMVEVIDPDAARDSLSRIVVTLTTTDGAKIDVLCVISDAYLESSPLGIGIKPLEEGRFLGQIQMQLGSHESPSVIPRSATTAVQLIGGAKLPAGTAGSPDRSIMAGVLNLTGKDIVTAEYEDALHPEKSPGKPTGRGRIVASGVMLCTDRDYRNTVARLHVGEKCYLMVEDADQDQTDGRDEAHVEAVTQRGEAETIVLVETTAHSGVFTGSVNLLPSEKPVAKNSPGEDPALEAYFGDVLELHYVDQAAQSETGTLDLSRKIPIVVGTDGKVTAFSKIFNDETLAVETQFKIAECHYEMFKSHKKLERTTEQTQDLLAGRKVLKEVMKDFPNPKYAPRVAYLLGQFAQELGEWDEAIESYRSLIRRFPESTLAPDSQYKLAQCLEEANRLDDALEEYVTLAATYPKSPLIANVMVRISDRFYKQENYEVAAQVGEKFLERFPDHQLAPRIAYWVGMSRYKGKDYAAGGKAFDRFVKEYPDDTLCADALFWSAENYRLAGNAIEAFRRYNRCRWDFPSSDAAKYARGRLATPAMLALFESEATAVEDEEERENP